MRTKHSSMRRAGGHALSNTLPGYTLSAYSKQKTVTARAAAQAAGANTKKRRTQPELLAALKAGALGLVQCKRCQQVLTTATAKRIGRGSHYETKRCKAAAADCERQIQLTDPGLTV
jgi:hypothetical protein